MLVSGLDAGVTEADHFEVDVEVVAVAVEVGDDPAEAAAGAGRVAQADPPAGLRMRDSSVLPTDPGRPGVSDPAS